MSFEELIKEIMWEYDCTKNTALNLIEKYKIQGRYMELVEIVKFKRKTPEIERRTS